MELVKISPSSLAVLQSPDNGFAASEYLLDSARYGIVAFRLKHGKGKGHAYRGQYKMEDQSAIQFVCRRYNFGDNLSDS